MPLRPKEPAAGVAARGQAHRARGHGRFFRVRGAHGPARPREPAGDRRRQHGEGAAWSPPLPMRRARSASTRPCPWRRARELCPHAVYIQANHKKYGEASRRVMRVLGDFTPAVQAVSVDEAYLDLSGTERLHGPPLQTAARNPGSGSCARRTARPPSGWRRAAWCPKSRPASRNPPASCASTPAGRRPFCVPSR